MKKNTIPQVGMLPQAHWLAKCTDAIVIYLFGFILFFLFFRQPLWQGERYQWLVAFSSLATVGILSINGVYRSWRGVVRVGLVVRIFHSFLTLAGLIASYLYLTKTGHYFSRQWFVTWLGSAFLCTVLLRVMAYRVLNSLRQRGMNTKTVALYGTQAACATILQAVRNERWAGFQVTTIRLLNGENLAPEAGIDIAPFNADNDGQPNCNEIWLCLPLAAGEELNQILQTLRHSTANIRFLPDFRGVRLINHQVSSVVGHYAFDLSISPMHGGQRVTKWLMDKCFAIVALLCLAPFLLLVTLWIGMVAGRPIFYRQTRVGWNGQTFEMIKFRTMPVDNEKTEVTWGGAAQKKTIPLGRWLRRLSIDELPQFWNVLKGDMSVVGPRPERPQFVAQFKNEIAGYMQKHMVKAGMTGWAQVQGWRGDTDLQQRINHDLWYIENWSIWLDLKILLLTIVRIFHDSAAN